MAIPLYRIVLTIIIPGEKMKLKSVVKKFSALAAESVYLWKYKHDLKKDTIYCDCGEFRLPDGLKRVRTPVNAQYIITKKPFDRKFIKKSGQTAVVVCSFAHTEFFGDFQRTLLMSDYIVCPENAVLEELLKEFCIDGIYRGKIITEYDENLPEDIIKGRYSEKIYRKNKKNVLIYSGSLAQNGLTASLLNLLSELENDNDVRYLITYREESLKKFPERLERLPECFLKVPFSGDFSPSVREMICYIFYFKFNISCRFILSVLNRFFKREWERLYGFIDIDSAVQFTGYEYGVIKLFEQFSGNNVIFVHNDMLSEIRYRHNQHRLTLSSAYADYSSTAIVSEDLRESTSEISGGCGNITVVPNCHNYRAVAERSHECVEFQPETQCSVSFEKLCSILASDTVKFITIGRFSPEKAHMRLIDAFGDYCREYGGNTCLIIIGGRGELYDETLRYAEKNGNNIILIRSMENPMPVLKSCDLFMLPSEYEGLGLVLLEADTLGLPVFATDVSGPHSFLSQYGGLLVENSRKGILEGMKLYREGKIHPMNIDYEKYNKTAAEKFRELV